MDKNFQGHLFWDTIRIQNLIWSNCLEIMVARHLHEGELCLNKGG